MLTLGILKSLIQRKIEVKVARRTRVVVTILNECDAVNVQESQEGGIGSYTLGV